MASNRKRKRKGRVLLSCGHIRLVMSSSGIFYFEQRDGTDNLGVQRWRRFDTNDLDAWRVRNVLEDAVGDALVRREARMRKRRAARSRVVRKGGQADDV